MTGDELQRFINELLSEVFKPQPDEKSNPQAMNGGLGMYSDTKSDGENTSTPSTFEEWVNMILGPGEYPELNDDGTDVDGDAFGSDGVHFHTVTTAWAVNPTIKELKDLISHLERQGFEPDTRLGGSLWTEIES